MVKALALKLKREWVIGEVNEVCLQTGASNAQASYVRTNPTHLVDSTHFNA